MKKSILRQMIKEELLKEGSGYDMKKIGGGIDSVYVDMEKVGSSKNNITVSVGLFSGGSKEDFQMPYGKNLLSIINSKESSKEIFSKLQYQRQIINDAVTEAVVKNLKIFEKNTEKAIFDAIKKYNK